MKRALTTLATVVGMVLAGALFAVLAPGLALGTLTEVGIAPGDVTTYSASTGASGVSGVTGSTGATAPGATGATGTTTNTSPVPQCPGLPCEAITETTGFQVKVGPARSLTTIPRSGSIVAWTVTLGLPSTTDITYFDRLSGGSAEAGIAILKPGKHLAYTLVAQSPPVQLTPYFGDTAQFPLTTSIPVTKGDIVALTVPTWAPTLADTNAAGHSYGKFVSWRSSRQLANKGCSATSSQTAQQSLRTTVQYACLYQNARLTYSALLVSTP